MTRTSVSTIKNEWPIRSSCIHRKDEAAGVKMDGKSLKPASISRYLTINISGCTSIPSSFVFSDNNNKHHRFPADLIGSPCQSPGRQVTSLLPVLPFLSLIYLLRDLLSSSSPAARPLRGASLIHQIYVLCKFDSLFACPDDACSRRRR